MELSLVGERHGKKKISFRYTLHCHRLIRIKLIYESDRMVCLLFSRHSIWGLPIDPNTRTRIILSSTWDSTFSIGVFSAALPFAFILGYLRFSKWLNVRVIEFQIGILRIIFILFYAETIFRTVHTAHTHLLVNSSVGSQTKIDSASAFVPAFSPPRPLPTHTQHTIDVCKRDYFVTQWNAMEWK